MARAVHEKLVRRHPHVFGDVEARTPGRVRENWEALKEEEGREGIFHHVPETFPALLLARKVQRRAAAIGFEYPDVAGALTDLESELEEVKASLVGSTRRPRHRPTSASRRRSATSSSPVSMSPGA